MRLLFVTPRADSAHIAKWIDAARTAGHDLRMICSESGTASADVPTTVVETESGVWAKTLGRMRFAYRCRRLIRAFEPDVVHVHYMIPTPIVLGYVKFRPLVISVWGGDIAVPRSPLNEYFRRKALRSSSRILATNRMLAYVCRAHVGMHHPIDVIPFGVDCERFCPRERDHDGVFRVGCVKHFEEIYGIEYLLRAVAELRRDVPNVELVLVGDGTLRPKLERLTQELDIGSLVTFAGHVPNASVPALMSSFDVLVNPSLYESFGVSILEGSACGVPIVASDAGGIPDVVLDERTGILVPPADAPALAAALRRLSEDVDLARRMGAEGRRFVLERYQWRRSVEDVERVYRHLVEA